MRQGPQFKRRQRRLQASRRHRSRRTLVHALGRVRGCRLLAGFLLYLAAVAAIGVVAARRTASASDYVIGSRSLSAPTAALSAGASDMSGWLLLGLPGAVFASGLGEGWILVGLAIGAWASWRLVAAPLRRFTARLDGAVTLPQFFGRRVGARTPLVAVVATLLVLFFYAIYTAAGFVAGAKLFAATLGMEYHTALWLGVALVLAYTAIGGFLAVSWTDFLQALLMLAALATVALLAFAADAETSAMLRAPALGWMATAGALAWGLGYFGQPHFLARFMAIRDAGAVPPARRIALAWMIVAGAAALAVGAAGYGSYGADGLADPETVFLALAQDLLPAWLAGVVVAGVLAAVMSTVDSQLLVASTALVEDVLRPLRPGLADRQRLLASRGTVAVIAVAAGLLGMDPGSGVLDLVAYAWAGLGASFGPAVLACLFWRRTTELGLVAGMAAGAATAVLWHELDGGLFDLYEMVPAFLAGCMAIAVASRKQARAGALFDRLRDATGADRPSKARHRRRSAAD